MMSPVMFASLVGAPSSARGAQFAFSGEKAAEKEGCWWILGRTHLCYLRWGREGTVASEYFLSNICWEYLGLSGNI